MKGKLAILAAASLLLSACAHDPRIRPPQLPDDSSPVASAAGITTAAIAVRQARVA
jgi:outer membrane biogenesis lipoprotein LolB